ncbi:ABC transporter permease [Micrococcus sp. IITD107]|uniref:ABC transporter permease n=1 Tax=Micrococcus sp. IITD107 TaxID=3342790 RepID=UPI0035B9E9D2
MAVNDQAPSREAPLAQEPSQASSAQKPRSRRRGRRDPMMWFYLAILALVGLAAVVVPLLSPHTETGGSIADRYEGMSSEHWLGTDRQGRDLLVRLAIGAQSAIIAAAGVSILTAVLATILSLTAVWFGGWVDGLISRVLDFLFAFPNLLLAVLAVAIFGPSVQTAVVALAIGYAPYSARIIRSVALRERALPYVRSSELQGISGLLITARHLLPNVRQQILTGMTINFGYAMIELAALSFLGLGVQPPKADWGLMVSDGQEALLAGHPAESILAGLGIVITVAAVGYVGERLGGRKAEGRS